MILANFKKAKSACILFKRIDAKFARIHTNSRKKLAKNYFRATKVFAISGNLLKSLKLSDAKISKRIHIIKTEKPRLGKTRIFFRQSFPDRL